MHRYISQLLQDIAAARRPDIPPAPPPAAEDDHTFAGNERYMLEEPDLTLGQHCGLNAEAFPPAERLALSQQQEVVDALKETYFSYNVSLDLPEALPTAEQYRFYVKALDEKCFIDDRGLAKIHFCEEEPEACPFGWRYCTCLDAWLDEVEAIHRKPPSEWTEEDCLAIAIQEVGECRVALEEGKSPNKRYVLQLLDDIEKARTQFHRASGSIRLEEPEEEDPRAEYRPFFEWMGLPDAIFPPLERLAEPETEALSFALLLLYGKDPLTIPLISVSAPVRYRQLVEYFTMPLRRVGDMQFLASRKGLGPPKLPDLLAGL